MGVGLVSFGILMLFRLTLVVDATLRFRRKEEEIRKGTHH